MATLEFTGINKQFKYTDGVYISTGNKVISGATFQRVDGGSVNKSDAFIASYNYAVEGGSMVNLWVNFNDPLEAANVLAQINACFAALNAENE